MHVYLCVQDQQENRMRWMPFIGSEMTLGRERANDLVLLRSTVAKHHCKIIQQDEQFAYQQLHRPMDGSSTHDVPIETQPWRPLHLHDAEETPIPTLHIAEFSIVLKQPPKQRYNSLHAAVRLLRQSSETPSITLERALRMTPIPQHILHHFAIDCAERSLLREECAGREPSVQCWEALRSKRRWIEGKASEQERHMAQMAVEKQVFYCFEEDIFSTQYAMYAAAASVAAATQHHSIFAIETNASHWAADSAAATAANRIKQTAHPSRQALRKIWHQARTQEYIWQCHQLAKRIEHALRIWQRFMVQLVHRTQHLEQHIQNWKDSLEYALFV